MRIFDRYVLREILPPFSLALLIFTFVLTLPPVMRQLEQLVAKGVSWGVAAKLILLLVPSSLGLTIPIATLVGILIAASISGSVAASVRQRDGVSVVDINDVSSSQFPVPSSQFPVPSFQFS